MNPLNNINDITRDLIRTIVEGYRETSELIETDKSSPVYGPGIMFRQLFCDSDCFIEIYQDDDKNLAIEIEFSKDGECGLSTGELITKHSKFGGKKKSIFVEKLIYLKSLFDSGLIYFSEERVEDSKMTLPKYTSSLEKEKVLADKSNFMTWFISYPSLYKFVCKYYYSNVIPLSSLVSFYDNDYKTKEDIEYRQQLSINEDSLKIARESLEKTRESLTIARRANRNTIWISLFVCCVSVFASILIAVKVPVSIHDSFSNTVFDNMDKIIKLDSIANENSYVIHSQLDSLLLFNKRNNAIKNKK